MRYVYGEGDERREFADVFEAMEWVRDVVLDFEDGPNLAEEMESWLERCGWSRVDLLAEAEYHGKDFGYWVGEFADGWVKRNMREVE